ncbi:DUF5131 family protein [Kitasatospora sp. NPDC057738]|uniref:DUF5131 family protein n=1 Tax=unclassified Kitasatospora TaxID=2633591 RepID=UPI00368CE2B8
MSTRRTTGRPIVAGSDSLAEPSAGDRRPRRVRSCDLPGSTGLRRRRRVVPNTGRGRLRGRGRRARRRSGAAAGERSGIEWTEVTWNPTTGCDRVSAGCDNCYALTLAKRLKAMGAAKYQNDGDPRTSGPGFDLTLHPDVLRAPYGWRGPRTVFVDSMSDLFHARVPLDFVRRVFAVMADTPQHTYQVLTQAGPPAPARGGPAGVALQRVDGRVRGERGGTRPGGRPSRSARRCPVPVLRAAVGPT